MKKIDMNSWPRREHYFFFQSRQNPCVSITSKVNTYLLEQYRESCQNKPRFSDCIYFAAMKAANEIEEFRMRIIDREPVIYDIINAAFTYIPTSQALHANCVAKFTDNFQSFVQNASIARVTAEANPSLYPQGGDSQALIYLSIIDKIEFSSLTNPWGDPYVDTVPRIIFGKINQSESKLPMPVSVECLHSFIDGYHLSEFFNKFDTMLSSPEKIFCF